MNAHDTAPIGWWVTQKQAAVMLGVHPDTVRAMVRRGRLPAVQLNSRMVIRRDDLDAFINGQHDDTQDAS